MAEEQHGVNVNVTATIDQFVSELRNGLGAVNGFSSNVSNAFGGIGTAINAIKGPLIAFTAILAGGKIFGDTIKATKEWVGEVKNLSNVLGISLKDASAYAKVMRDYGIEVGTVERVAQVLTMRMQAQGEKFEKLGITVRNASTGALLPAADVMKQVAEKAMKLNEGGERQAFLTATLGRGWRSFLPVLKLTQDKLAEAAEELKKFGIVVDKNSVAAVEKYKVAMNNLGDATDAVKIRLGLQLMPMLTKVAQEFSKLALEVFPYVMAFFEGVLIGIDAIVQAFRILWVGLKESYDLVMSFGQSLGVVGKALLQFLHGDYSDAGATLRDGLGKVWEGVKRDAVKNGAEIDSITQGFAKRTSEAVARATGKVKVGQGDPDKKEKPSGAGFVDDQSKDLMRRAHEEQVKIVREGGKMTEAEELAFWERYLAIAASQSQRYEKAYEDLTLKVADMRAADKQKKLTIAQEEVDIAAAWGEKSAEATYAAEEQKYLLVEQAYGKEHELTKAAYRKLEKAAQEYDAKMDAIAMGRVQHQSDMALKRVELAEQEAQFMLDTGQIGADQMIAADAEFERQRYEIKKKALEDKKVLAAQDVEQTRQLNDQLEQLEAEHAGKMAEIGRKMFADTKAQVDSFLGPIKNAFEEVFDGILNGQLNVAKVLDKLWKSIAKTLIQTMLDIVTKKAAMAVTEALIGRVTAASEVTRNAAVAASGAAASVASTPFAGPALAAAAFAETMGLVMGTAMPMAMAAGGADLGSFQAPVTQLHPKEMVLPARLAEGMRALIESGGNGGQPQQVAVHLNVQGAIDGESVYRVLRDNMPQVSKALQEATMNGRFGRGG